MTMSGQKNLQRQLSWTPTRVEGLLGLERFFQHGLNSYGQNRNYDYGSEDRSNVSLLSPWIKHRLISEPEILSIILHEYSLKEADKYIQQVVWRTYFKGWLEHRPSVWACYKIELARALDVLAQDAIISKTYETALSGRSGIDCFDHWLQELQTTGYIHNHARLWFASIWIFTFRLPWQLGANLFMSLLLDGDIASNTLSWRWVAGLHTPGKFYQATSENIAKFTNERFAKTHGLTVKATSLEETMAHPLTPLKFAPLEVNDDYLLLVTEDDCSPEVYIDSVPAVTLGLLVSSDKGFLKQSSGVRGFSQGAVQDAVERTRLGGVVLQVDDWLEPVLTAAGDNRLKTVVTPYAPVGPIADHLDLLEAALAPHGIELLQVRRGYDTNSWPYATKGFFAFKKNLPIILGSL